MKKKLFGLLMTFVLIFCFPVSAVADETASNWDSGYEEYQQLIDSGILDERVPFDYWQSVQQRANQLVQQLENSPDFIKVYDSASPASYFMTPGDVFVTNATSFNGLTGHAGIATSTVLIMHIARPGEHPAEIYLRDWNNDYTQHGWTKIYRHTNFSDAAAAARWARRTYAGSKAEYKIDMNLASTDKTYCSKIVWQSYYYGPSTHQANGPTIGIRMPYDLPSTIHNLRQVV